MESEHIAIHDNKALLRARLRNLRQGRLPCRSRPTPKTNHEVLQQIIQSKGGQQEKRKQLKEFLKTLPEQEQKVLLQLVQNGLKNLQDLDIDNINKQTDDVKLHKKKKKNAKRKQRRKKKTKPHPSENLKVLEHMKKDIANVDTNLDSIESGLDAVEQHIIDEESGRSRPMLR